MTEFTFIDLFAGIGGFRQALSPLGGVCLGFSEIFNDAINTYCANYNEDVSSNLGDITKIKNLPEHDLMTAGVPCQSWSIAGKNLGFDDDRGQLWNDTLYLLNKSKPKAFIFENVKGLADPRNHKALEYILDRISEAGYYANAYVLNSYDYGVPQTRVRIYIVGFRDEKYQKRFRIPEPDIHKACLGDVLDGTAQTYALRKACKKENTATSDSPGHTRKKPRWSLSCKADGLNDYFLFNDLRNGSTTIHSWDIIETTERQKHICMLLLRNRRKKIYGNLDGNPLSLAHFQSLDKSITCNELEELINLKILKKIKYQYEINNSEDIELDDRQSLIIGMFNNGLLNISELKNNRQLKLRHIAAADILSELESLGVVKCIEERYDFKNTKISTGLFGINRIFLPSSDIYPTLVASDTNDFITNIDVPASSEKEYRNRFLDEIYRKKKYRQITKSEACRIQGFPPDFILPASRARWMHLIGNSVSVPVIRKLAQAVIATGVFKDNYSNINYEKTGWTMKKEYNTPLFAT